MDKLIVIAVDAMGGDFYPESPVLGALMALEKYPDISIKLLGDSEILNAKLSEKDVRKRYQRYYHRVSLVDAPELVPMEMKEPSKVVEMRHSSIFLGTGMSRLYKAHAFVSAGNTGAVMAAATVRSGRIRGIKRPAISVLVPTKNGPCVTLDVGANSTNTPLHLTQFAIMGSIYSRQICGIENPTVALMSIGEEASKGNVLVTTTNENLKSLHEQGLINFYGNVQGGDILAGTANVVVVDGFTGNALLKMAESMMPTIKDALAKNLKNGSLARKLSAGLSKVLLKSTIAAIRKDFDYEQYGGAPLLGVNGVIIIAHGKSSPLAMMHAIRVAKEAVCQKMVDKISAAIASIPNELFKAKPDS